MSECGLMDGMVSQCVRDARIVVKDYYNESESKYSSRGIDNHWKKEITALRRMNREKHIPNLVSIDENNRTITMQYAGKRISKDNLPKNWEQQCKAIDEIQEKHGIFHQDIKPKNILVYYGVIYLIDWGLYSTNPKDLKPMKNVLKNL